MHSRATMHIDVVYKWLGFGCPGSLISKGSARDGSCPHSGSACRRRRSALPMPGRVASARGDWRAGSAAAE